MLGQFFRFRKFGEGLGSGILTTTTEHRETRNSQQDVITV